MQHLIEEKLTGPALFVLPNIPLQLFKEVLECNNYVAVLSTTSSETDECIEYNAFNNHSSS